ncbi:ring-cleaving dioxygenase [Aquibium sp. A9E412]|uniref:ring-cleaving dioxygenase n=1 Tax=Aquibium sp. A9E412 TaxID=2976767 RepID=UPI0025B17EEB|nr:ring-cleaving dioxygenase [Aquibium sp. A9E412]MDN2565407.1 ring-cleaving dioxygenase [Aquibium sp. A9E412]
MNTAIKGLHHVTSLASDAAQNNRFFTRTLGLRRVKKTVNFDAPEVYHLYYADGAGTPGTVMTYFPFPGARRGRRGTGEAGETAFAIPQGASAFWQERLAAAGVSGIAAEERFGERRLSFAGPDGDGFALVETAADGRTPWTGADVPEEAAIRGFHSVTLTLREAGPTEALLEGWGYAAAGEEGRLRRLALAGGNGAHILDIVVASDAPPAEQGAGSVHHIAFAVEDRAAQAKVQEALAAAGHQVTPVIDRDYFYAIYFRSPGGVLFEVATHEPGFDRDEAPERLGEALKLPKQHAHLRAELERHLPPIGD